MTAHQATPSQLTDPTAGDKAGSELRAALGALQRRWILIAACVLLTALTAVLFSLLQQKEYSASAQLLFRDPGFAQQAFGNAAPAPSADPSRDAATNLQLVGLPVVAARTASALGQGATADEIAGEIDTAAVGNSDTVSIKATDPSPERAARIANTFAREFIAFRAATDRSKLLDAQRHAQHQFDQLSPTDKSGARGDALSRSAERLGILASLQTGNAELVQPAEVPKSPSSPKTRRNALLGVLLGLVLGIALAFLFEHLNRRLRRPEEVQEAFGLPVLAVVPESKAISAANELPVAGMLPFVENEAFRTLRAGLRYFNVDRDVRSVLVSSASPGEGKTTVAWQLARAAATSSKAILVDTDLRNPGLARLHGLTVSPGLSEILTQQTQLTNAIQSVHVSTGGNGSKEGEVKLDVIAAGARPPNPAELIESNAMGEVLAELGQRYDLVVLDTPPTGLISDAFPLMGKVDGVIVVARLEQTTRDSAEHIRDQLRRLGAPVLGVVANVVKVSRRSRYGYGYGYRYHDRAQAEPEELTSVGANGAGS